MKFNQHFGGGGTLGKHSGLTRHIRSWKNFSGGFTLAEVLITLGIIGVVAALTIPSIVNNGNERKNIVKLKKVYSQLSTVFEQAVDEKGVIKDYLAPYPGMYDTDSHKAFRDYFTSYFNAIRIGEYTANWSDGIKSDGNSFSTFVGSDGTAYVFRLLPNNCESSFGSYSDKIPVCGEIFVDLYSGQSESWSSNAKNRVVGKNVFMFHVTKDKIIPAGIPADDTLECYTNKYACTQWVLLNENMDYLHCSDLSWNGKRKCK